MSAGYYLPAPIYLDDFTGIPPEEGKTYTFLNDPEACPWPIYHWFQDYAEEYDFEGATADYLTLSDLFVESGESLSVMTSSSTSLNVNAVFADGHTENISSVAKYTIDDPEIIQVFRGRIYALKDGEATLLFRTQAQKGRKCRLPCRLPQPHSRLPTRYLIRIFGKMAPLMKQHIRWLRVNTVLAVGITVTALTFQHINTLLSNLEIQIHADIHSGYLTKTATGQHPICLILAANDRL